MEFRLPTLPRAAPDRPVESWVSRIHLGLEHSGHVGQHGGLEGCLGLEQDPVAGIDDQEIQARFPAMRAAHGLGNDHVAFAGESGRFYVSGSRQDVRKIMRVSWTRQADSVDRPGGEGSRRIRENRRTVHGDAARAFHGSAPGYVPEAGATDPAQSR